MLLAVLQAESSLDRKIVLQLLRDASLESKTRTVARVFHDSQLTWQDVTDVLLPLISNSKFTLIMDRITLHCGQTLSRPQNCGQVRLTVSRAQKPVRVKMEPPTGVS